MNKVYVRTDRINGNRGLPTDEMMPPIVVKHEGDAVSHHKKIEITGPCVVVYDPHANGPKVWIETEAEIKDV